MKKYFLLGILGIITIVSAGCAACVTTEDEAMNALDGYGYTNVELGGVSFWGCSDSDKWGRKFEAETISGKQVDGIVCCGKWVIFDFDKKCTVRF